MKHSGRTSKLLARWMVMTLSMSILLFAAAGTTQLPSLRHYLLTFSAFLLAIILAIDPQLAEDRSHSFKESGTSGRTSAGLEFVTTLVVAAFEVGHLHFLHAVPARAKQASLMLFALAMTLQMWAMVVNPFFSAEVRLQPERGHKVVACGPYRLVRHPGYLAMLIAIPTSALAIGSWLALAPAAAFCGTILKRVTREEEFLLKNLAGYPEYLGKVRGRFLPRMDFHRHEPTNLASQCSDRSQP